MASTAATSSTGFGDLLRHYRQAAGLTQAELAERAGLSVRGINDLERGARQTPRRDTVALLAEALGLSEEERTAFATAARRETGQHAPAPSPASPPSADPGEAIASALPTGTVTFLFTDLEGSTRLLQQLGSSRYGALQAEHRRLVRAAIEAHGGREVDTQGDSFFIVFPTAGEAVAAAAEAQRAVAAYPWPDGAAVRVRMGLHTGVAQVVGERYVGLEVHRAARIAAAGHGGQVLLSEAARVLAEPNLPENATLRDLGAHRLKDLQRPEHLWQLVLPDVPDLPADFPPLATLDAHPHNLPIQPTALVGREREVAEVCALLRREDVRLVTLTGPGGMGKTRLGLQVAAELVEVFADGVWFVPLAHLTDPELVIPTMAQTLGLREAGGQPIATMLAVYLRDKHMMLVLDNFEQVVVAATALARLLETCAALKVLVTSRATLHLRGEKQVRVPPLPLPDPAYLPPPEHLVQYPAVALFVRRAQDADAAFALTNATALAIAAICARVEGLPLAIELAAAKVRVLPPPALLMRLERQLPLLMGGARDLEVRQQTLRATLAWSENLLIPAEQRLFRRLAVFVGGFTLEAAEAVCAAPEGTAPLELDVLEGLGGLVDQSLVQQQTVGDEEGGGEARFRLLYVIREYALEQLGASEEAEALRRAHAAYYLRLVEERAFAVYGPEAAAWLGRLEREHDNFRAALAWARQRGEAEFGLRLAAALGAFWYSKGYYNEGRGWVEGLLALASQADGDGAGDGDDGGPGALGVAGVSAVARAKALCAASYFAFQQGDNERAQAAAAEALALARGRQAGWAAGAALDILGLVAWGRGDLEQATAYLEESVAQLRAVGELWLAAAYLAEVGDIARVRGDLEQAMACCEESLTFARRTGADFVAGSALRVLADVARLQGDLARAEVLGRERLLAARRLGSPAYLATGLEGLARTAAAAAGERVQAEQAARLLGTAASLRERVGATQRPHETADMERAVAEARLTLGEERWAAAFATGHAMTLEEAIAEALEETARQ